MIGGIHNSPSKLVSIPEDESTWREDLAEAILNSSGLPSSVNLATLLSTITNVDLKHKLVWHESECIGCGLKLRKAESACPQRKVK